MTTPTERIDHAAEALRIMADGESAVAKARLAQHESEFQTADAYGKKAAGCWGQAQVHATLALVEQQRIANLIALSQAVYPNGSRVDSWAICEPVAEYSLRVKPEVRKGLGL